MTAASAGAIRGVALLSLLCALLAACGGSTSTNSATASTSSTSVPSTSTAAPAPGTTGTSPGVTAAPGTTGTSSAAPPATNPPGGGSTTATTTSQPSSGGTSGAGLPAIFTVGRGDSVNPLIVSAPVHVPIELAVISRDGHAHRVLVRISPPHLLTVPAGGRASILVSGLAAGRYIVEIDGVSGAALVVGGEPGP